MNCVRLLMVALVCSVSVATSQAAEPTGPVYEMRVYFAAKGKLDNLNARFRDHTVKLFEKHGITNIGYFVPLENTDERLIYIVKHKSLEGRKAAFAAFGADPEWKAAAAASEKDGKILTKIESFFMSATDYSPPIEPKATDAEKVFELRTYLATEGHLSNLNARFRDHTVKLFEKHGMTNVAYWNLLEGQKVKPKALMESVTPVGGATVEFPANGDATPAALVYMLAHNSTAAAKASFDAFRVDPLWLEARKASETKAGGSLTVKDGVKSLFLKATDYSPMK